MKYVVLVVLLLLTGCTTNASAPSSIGLADPCVLSARDFQEIVGTNEPFFVEVSPQITNTANTCTILKEYPSGPFIMNNSIFAITFLSGYDPNTYISTFSSCASCVEVSIGDAALYVNDSAYLTALHVVSGNHIFQVQFLDVAAITGKNVTDSVLDTVRENQLEFTTAIAQKIIDTI